MSLYGAFDSTKHFEELNTPLVTAGGVITPAQRRARAIDNLFNGDATPGVAFPDTVTTPALLTAEDIGTVTTSGTTAVEEHGDGLFHVTKLTLTAFAVGTIPDNAALGIGAEVYTFPAGAILVENVALVGGLTGAVSVTAQTPEVGCGTTIGTGVVSVLSTTMEDFVDGGAAGIIGGATVAPDIAGATFAKGTLATSAQGVYLAASGGKAHKLFLNAAATWADVDAAGAATFTGTITVRWRFMA